MYTQCVPDTIGPCLFTQRCIQSWPCTFTMSWCCRTLHVVLITRHAMPHTYPQERNGTVQVVLLGQQSVGKTCLVDRYINSTFETAPKNTIGVAFAAKKVGRQQYSSSSCLQSSVSKMQVTLQYAGPQHPRRPRMILHHRAARITRPCYRRCVL